MSRSKIIVDCASGKIGLVDVLFELKVLLSDFDEPEINDWIDNELVGYKSKKDVPDYRKSRGMLYGNIQQAYSGGLLNRNLPIPVKIDKVNILDISVTEPIAAVSNFARTPRDGNKDFVMNIDQRLATDASAFELNEFTQIEKSWIKPTAGLYIGIVNAVKKRVLDILLFLEKKYGNLDDLAIDFKVDEEKESVATIINIIKGDMITLGDGNFISESTIGKQNEHKYRK